jgi:hypothetical protein
MKYQDKALQRFNLVDAIVNELQRNASKVNSVLADAFKQEINLLTNGKFDDCIRKFNELSNHQSRFGIQDLNSTSKEFSHYSKQVFFLAEMFALTKETCLYWIKIDQKRLQITLSGSDGIFVLQLIKKPPVELGFKLLVRGIAGPYPQFRHEEAIQINSPIVELLFDIKNQVDSFSGQAISIRKDDNGSFIVNDKERDIQLLAGVLLDVVLQTSPIETFATQLAHCEELSELEFKRVLYFVLNNDEFITELSHLKFEEIVSLCRNFSQESSLYVSNAKAEGISDSLYFTKYLSAVKLGLSSILDFHAKQVFFGLNEVSVLGYKDFAKSENSQISERVDALKMACLLEKQVGTVKDISDMHSVNDLSLTATNNSI